MSDVISLKSSNCCLYGYRFYNYILKIMYDDCSEEITDSYLS